MELHIHVEARGGHMVATIPNLPGCQGVGPDAETAIRRLKRVVHAACDRLPPSPFASVRKRLGERSVGF